MNDGCTARDCWDQVHELHRMGWTGRSVAVGQLDSGIDAGHAALAGRVGSFLYFDGRGRADAERPCADEGWHGTHIAGLVCGSFRGPDGATGVAPDARLHLAAVIDSGQVLSRILGGLDWMCDQPVRVLTLPFGVAGGTPLLAPLVAAARARGMLPVAPIGNDGAGRCRSPGDYPDVLAVGAVDAEGRVARFSGSSGVEHQHSCCKPDLLAPGVDVWSAAAGGGLRSCSGTSMACAFVSGVAALLLQACPDAESRDLEWALTSTARPLRADRRHRCRYGVVQPLAALDQLRSGRRPPPSSQPTVPAAWHRDPRLLEQCRRAPDDAHVDAALVFDPGLPSPGRGHATDPGFIHEVVAEAVQDATLPLDRIRCLRHGNVAILRAPARSLRALLAQPRVRIGSAVDVNLVQL